MTLRERALRKATRRLIPFLFLIYVVAYLDRVNVSFAQLQLEDDLGFSDTIFGLGAGIFSLGYVIFGVPSNLALERFGARRWLAGIMIVWGLLSASMLFIESAASFYVLRFLLGVAEAGFFPGIILFLTWWFPEDERTRVLALFLTAISVAYVAGGPLSGGLLELDGLAGLEGWQWLFLMEGLPAVALGFVTLRYLDERPEDAGWLEPEERELLAAEVARESELKEAVGVGSLGASLRNGQVWLLSLIYFLIVGAAFGLTFFVPDLVQDRTGYSDFEVGALAAVPYGVATVAMLVVARRADVAPSRRPYLIAAVLVGAAGCVLTALRPLARPAHRRDHAVGGRAAVGDPGLLGLPDRVPHRLRGGRGDRADRGDREPRRLRRPRLHGHQRGPDRRLRDAADGVGGHARTGQRAGAARARARRAGARAGGGVADAGCRAPARSRRGPGGREPPDVIRLTGEYCRACASACRRAWSGACRARGSASAASRAG